MSLGKRIKILRVNKGLTQEKVAEETGYKGKATPSAWENDVSEPDIKSLKKLAIIFGVTLDELIEGDSKAKTTDKTYHESTSEDFETLVNVVSDLKKRVKHLENKVKDIQRINN